jgi:hypothetical protein
MKLNRAAFVAVLVVLAGVSAGSAQASRVSVVAPDPGCASLGTITVPVITLGGAPGDCTDFTWGGSNPLNALGIIVTSVEPPLTCSIVSEINQAFNACVVVIGDLTAPVTPLETLALDTIISGIPDLTAGQKSGLEGAVGDLTVGDGFAVAYCDPNNSSVPCSDLAVGATGGVMITPEPTELPLLAIGISFVVGLGWWKSRKPVLAAA